MQERVSCSKRVLVKSTNLFAKRASAVSEATDTQLIIYNNIICMVHATYGVMLFPGRIR